VRSFVSSHGLAHDLLLAILSSGHTLILSNQLLSEVARVLRYPRLMAVHGQSEEAIYSFTGWLRDAAEMVVLDSLTPVPIRDRNDIFVLQTALSGEADLVCSGDRDFFEPPASFFLASFGIEVLRDVDMMRRLNG
jgi:putative PIN family toxin of toxin-antitoxin system